MVNLETHAALCAAHDVATRELKEIKTPVRADVAQLTDAYPLEHVLRVLDNLIKVVS